MKIDVTLTAGQAQEYFSAASFFRLLEATGPVDLVFYLQGKEVERAENVGEGFAIRFNAGPEGAGFDKLRIQSPSTQAVEFVSTLNADVFYDKPPTGTITGTVALDATTLAALETVNVGNQPADQGAFTQAQKTVTNASAQLLAANAARRYLLIQNNDATGVVYVTIDGTAATTAKGIKIDAGGSYECAGFCPSGEIRAIGSIASNANVVAVEG